MTAIEQGKSSLGNLFCNSSRRSMKFTPPKRAFLLLLAGVALGVIYFMVLSNLLQAKLPTTADVGSHSEVNAKPVIKKVSKSSIFRKSSLSDPNVPNECKHFLKKSKPKTWSQDNREDVKSHRVPNNIHFLHYNPTLSSPKYLCAIESAARQNPDHEIIVHAKDPNAFKSPLIQEWVSRSPVPLHFTVKKIDYASAFGGTPVENWWKTKKYEKSKWVAQNLGNAFRLAAIYKYGGVYLDMDIISVNPVGNVGRALAMQDKDAMNNAFLSFGIGERFLWEAMDEFSWGFNGNVWGRNGPEVVTRTYKKKCSKAKEPISACKGISILSASKLYPFGYKQKHEMFEPWTDECEHLKKISDESIGVHWWNRRVKSVEAMPNSTVFSLLMTAYCPTLMDVFPEKLLGISPKASFGAPNLLKEDPELMKPGQKKK